MNLETIVNTLQYYLTETDLGEFEIIRINDSLEISLEKAPSVEQVNRLKDLIFFSDIIQMPCADDSIIVSGNKIHINMQHHNTFTAIYDMIQSFGVKVIAAEIKEHELIFTYKLAGRQYLNCDELDTLQYIVDPKVKYHDSIRILGSEGTYNIYIAL